jgi:hypothetical protein
VIVDVNSFTLASQLNYDELTNFGAFEVTGAFADGSVFSFLIPVFCSGDGEVVHMALMPD